MSRLYFLSFLISISSVSGQNFEKEYPRETDSFINCIFEVEGYYYASVTSHHDQEHSLERNAIIWKLDLDGNIIDSLNFEFSNNWMVIYRMFPVDSGLFVYGQAIQKSDESKKSFYCLFGKDLQIKYLDYVATTNFNGLISYNSDTIIGIGNDQLFTIQTNTGIFNYETGQIGVGQIIVPFPNKHYVITCTGGSGIVLKKIDVPNFIVLKDTIIYISPYKIKYSFYKIHDSLIYFNSTYGKPFIGEDLGYTILNNDLILTDTVRIKTLGDTALKEGLDAMYLNLSDSSFFYGATFNFTQPAQPTMFYEQQRRFILYKIGLDRSIRWRKIYREADSNSTSYFFFSLDGTSDGGCIMAGWRWDYTDTNIKKRTPYILKVDSLGNATYNPYLSTSATKPTPDVLSLFPNPANDFINVILPEGITKGTLLLFDITGREAMVVPLSSEYSAVNVSSLKNGLYITRIDGLNSVNKLVIQK